MTRVVVYTAPNSEWCEKVKQFLKENDIRFDEVDLSKEPERIGELEQKSGQRGVPVIDVDGVIVVGFDEEKLIKALRL